MELTLPGSSTERHPPGYRGYTLGESGSGGYHGFNWSSTVSNTDGTGLGFDMTWLNPSYASSRAYGFQLRCLSE